MIDSECYASQWLLTIFAYDLPPELAWRVFEGFLVRGWSVVYAAVLALLRAFVGSDIG